MIYQVDGLNLFKDDNLVASQLQSENSSLYILGDFMGAVLDQSTLDKEASLKYLKYFFARKDFNSQLKSFMPNIVGSCIFILIDKNSEITFFSSFSSSGLFFSRINNNIKLSTHEECLTQLVDKDNKDIDEDELLANMTLHTIFCRSPFKTFLKKVTRVPAGAYIQIDVKDNYKTKRGILFNRTEIDQSQRDQYFKNLLNGVLELQAKYYKENLYLFFSGGIDSSLLLSATKKIKKNIKAIFIPYHGVRSRATYTASFVSKILKTNLAITKMGILDDSFIKSSAQSGFGTLSGMQYLGAGNRVDHLDLADKTINVLSGQNADTLFHIDTFAPASTVVGYKRFIANISARKKRYIYSDSSLTNIKSFNKFNNILEHIASSLDEHEGFNSSNKIIESNIKKLIRTHKINHSYTPILDILDEEYSIKENFSSSDSGSKIFSLKVMRWFRTVQNVPVNYLNLSKASKINRLIPYTEGPIANFAINYKILPSDHFFEKRIIYWLFFKLSKLNYRLIVNLAFIANFPRLIFDKIQFLFFKKESIADGYKNNISSLQMLTTNYHDVHKLFKNEEIINYLLELQYIIDANTITSVNLTKQDEIVRYAGAIYFLNKMFKI